MFYLATYKIFSVWVCHTYMIFKNFVEKILQTFFLDIEGEDPDLFISDRIRLIRYTASIRLILFRLPRERRQVRFKNIFYILHFSSPLRHHIAGPGEA